MRATSLPVAGLFIAAGIAYLGFSWSTVLGDFGGDNTSYLLMAQHFSPYSPSSNVAEYFFHQSIFPPLFPLLLGWTGGGESLLAAHLVTTACLLAAFVVFFCWLRLEGLSRYSAAISLLALTLMPGLYLQALLVHSENLYLLCSLTALLCATQALRRNAYPWLAMTIISISAAYLTRGAGLSLVAAFLIWLWLHRLPHRPFYTLTAIAPVLLWSLFGGSDSASYWHQLVQGYHDPAAWLEQVRQQGQHLLQGWRINFGQSLTAWISGMVLLILGLAAAAWRTWMRRLDGVYVWFYLSMILLWPFPAEAQRMAIVLLPVIFAQTVWILYQWRWEKHRVRPYLISVLALLMITSLPELALTIQRFFAPLPASVPQAYRHANEWYGTNPAKAAIDVRYAAAIESHLLRLQHTTPEDVCLLSIKPALTGYLTHRISKAPPGIHTDNAAFEHEIAKLGCRYVHMSVLFSPSYPEAMYPYRRLENQLEILNVGTITDEQQQSIVSLLGKLR